MFGFLRKQLKKGVERLARKIEEPEGKPAEKRVTAERELAESRISGATPRKKKPLRGRPELPPSERPIEVREDEPQERTALPEELYVSKGEFEEAKQKQLCDVEALREEAKAEQEEKKGLFARLRGAVSEKTLSGGDIDEFFEESEPELLQNNVALEVSDFLKNELKGKLAGRPIKRSQAASVVTRAFEESIFDAVNQGSIDIEGKIKAAKKEGRPLLVVFLGFNGGGKTTSISKLAHYLAKKKHGVVLAAGDTFRAASIEQLETHARRLGVDMVKHKYGADAAAVIFDAVQHAKSRGLDAVLADTAGRTHADKNLMEELKKLVKVNKPDLKVLVVDSLTGNDAVEQARQFNDAVGVDAVFMTKVDVNEKGGSILSVCYAIRKPILFMGTGQGYDDIRPFKPDEFVKSLLE